MAVDTSMYANFRMPDFVGAYQQGKEFKQKQEMMKKQKLQEEAMSGLYTMGPDGKMGINPEGMKRLAQVDPNQYHQIQTQQDQMQRQNMLDQRSQQNADREYFLKKRELDKKSAGPVLTAGQEAADKELGKDYVNYTATGRTNAVNTIEKLKELQLDVSKDIGFGEAGGTRLPLPDMLRSRLAVERRDNARNFANKTLKELFGGQLSDGERAAAAKEFWNDELDNESNSKRLAGKIKELEDNVKARDAQAQYFQNRGTLAGFSYKPNNDQEIQDKYAAQQFVDKISGVKSNPLIPSAHADFNNVPDTDIVKMYRQLGGK